MLLPLGRSFVIGGMLLAVGMAALSSRSSTPKRFKLVLDAERESRCYYESAWNDGEPVITDRVAGQAIVMSRQFDWDDGCTWLATETLTPTGSSYRYEYAEHPVSCMDGAEASSACHLIGAVHPIQIPDGDGVH